MASNTGAACNAMRIVVAGGRSIAAQSTARIASRSRSANAAASGAVSKAAKTASPQVLASRGGDPVAASSRAARSQNSRWNLGTWASCSRL